MKRSLFTRVMIASALITVAACGAKSASKSPTSAPATTAVSAPLGGTRLVATTDKTKPGWFDTRGDYAWSSLGAILHGGGSNQYHYAVLARNAGYLMLEAPAYCAPRVTSFVVNTNPLAGPQSVWFLGQQTDGYWIRAVYRIGSGQPLLINGIAVGFSGARTACRINVYSSVW